MDDKLKHLEFIQTVINRMSVNSFLLKGWNVALIVVLFSLGAKEYNVIYIVVAFIPVLFFWILDSYFLSLERSFRALYDKVRVSQGTDSDFSMDIKEFQVGENCWGKTFYSKTLLIFYFSMICIMLIVMFIIEKIIN